jgi:hypothetical protein
MKLVRKFNDFVKNRINENIEPIENPTESSPELEAGIDATLDAEAEDQSNLIDRPESSYEEEESGEYEGTKLMNELAEVPGAQKNGNVIRYKGHNIEFYSETNSFAIDTKTNFVILGKKKELKTVEEVVAYLEGETEEHSHSHSHKHELEPALESRRFKRRK